MEDNKNIVFVAGVHGVGKGYLCSRLAPMIDGEHVTASSLIRNRKALGPAKAISGIDANQDILVEELSKFQTAKSVVILDGHFCLYNKEFKIENLSLSLFKELHVSYIVILTCSPALIFESLINRDKDISQFSLSRIAQLQDAELNQSDIISKALCVPIMSIDVTTVTTSDLARLSSDIKSHFRL